MLKIGKKVKIILPEVDKRIEIAKKKLNEYSIQIIEIDQYKDKISCYLDIISEYEFTTNWTNDMKIQYLNNPVNFGNLYFPYLPPTI